MKIYCETDCSKSYLFWLSINNPTISVQELKHRRPRLLPLYSSSEMLCSKLVASFNWYRIILLWILFHCSIGELNYLSIFFQKKSQLKIQSGINFIFNLYHCTHCPQDPPSLWLSLKIPRKAWSERTDGCDSLATALFSFSLWKLIHLPSN